MSLLAATPSRQRLEIPADATGVPLLPKLRGQFAEFLNRGSLVHLGALAPAHQCRCAVRVARAVRRIPRRRSAIRVEAFLGGTGNHATSAPSSGARNRPWCASSPLGVPNSLPESSKLDTGEGWRLDLPGRPPPAAHRPCPFGRLALPTASPHSLPLSRVQDYLPGCPSPTLALFFRHQPRLRSRLTLGRLPLPRNPQACGGVGSHHP